LKDEIEKKTKKKQKISTWANLLNPLSMSWNDDNFIERLQSSISNRSNVEGCNNNKKTKSMKPEKLHIKQIEKNSYSSKKSNIEWWDWKKKLSK
jgi:hypothetical protein